MQTAGLTKQYKLFLAIRVKKTTITTGAEIP